MCRSVRDSHQVPQRIDKVSLAGRWGEGGELQVVDVVGSEDQQ